MDDVIAFSCWLAVVMAGCRTCDFACYPPDPPRLALEEKASWSTPVPPSAFCVQKPTTIIDVKMRSQHSHVHQLNLHMGANGRLTMSFDFIVSTHHCNTFCSCIFTCCQFAKKQPMNHCLTEGDRDSSLCLKLLSYSSWLGIQASSGQ